MRSCPSSLVKVESLSGRKALVAGTVFENLGPLGLWDKFGKGAEVDLTAIPTGTRLLIREKEGIFTEIHAFLPPRGMKKRVHLSLSLSSLIVELIYEVPSRRKKRGDRLLFGHATLRSRWKERSPPP